MDYKSPFETEQVSQFDSFELQVNAQAQGFLRETAKWATFLSILAFIGVGFMVLFSIFAIVMDEDIARAASRAGGADGPSGILLGVIYLVFGVLMFLPALYLSKFAGKMKDALNSNRTDRLTEAFENLKAHYKTAGIITIIWIALFILSTIFTVISEIGKAAGAY